VFDHVGFSHANFNKSGSGKSENPTDTAKEPPSVGSDVGTSERPICIEDPPSRLPIEARENMAKAIGARVYVHSSSLSALNVGLKLLRTANHRPKLAANPKLDQNLLT
jgi:hypothetical protein